MYGLGFRQINLQKKIMRRHINDPAHKCLILEFSWGSLKRKYWRKKELSIFFYTLIYADDTIKIWAYGALNIRDIHIN